MKDFKEAFPRIQIKQSNFLVEIFLIFFYSGSFTRNSMVGIFEEKHFQLAKTRQTATSQTRSDLLQ